MSTFIGKYEAKTDAKGRVFIPSSFRKLLLTEERERFIIRKDPGNDCIIFYPERVWNKKLEELLAKIEEWNSEDQMLLLRYTEDAEWIEIDSQGRILLSKDNQQSIGLDNNEVLFIGAIDRFSIWSKKRYEQVRVSASDMNDLLKQKMTKKSNTDS